MNKHSTNLFHVKHFGAMILLSGSGGRNTVWVQVPSSALCVDTQENALYGMVRKGQKYMHFCFGSNTAGCHRQDVRCFYRSHCLTEL